MQPHVRLFSSAGAAEKEEKELPILYFKPGCPWCNEAIAFLDEHQIPCRRVDVTRDSAASTRLAQISPQGKVPTLEWHGEILADFGLAELIAFLRSRNVRLEGVWQ
jgi:glutaredoxin 3